MKKWQAAGSGHGRPPKGKKASVNGHTDNQRPGFEIETGNVRLKVIALTEHLKVTGIIYLNISGRSTARRPSDLLRYYTEEHLTISEAKVHHLQSGELLEDLPFLLLNPALVEGLYAEEADPAP
jgi:hypothetical protein